MEQKMVGEAWHCAFTVYPKIKYLDSYYYYYYYYYCHHPKNTNLKAVTYRP